jgi:hypothetical protein
MRKILTDFAHKRGMHCDTTSLCDVFTYAGHELPEAALFGLGEGLSFFYWRSKNIKYPVLGGRVKPLELDGRACRNLGVGLSVRASTSPRRAYDALKASLECGRPSMMCVDGYYLEYMRSKLHYGAHNIVVAGIDEDRDVVLVADRSHDGLLEVPISQLIDARASLHKPFPPRNRWFEFSFPSAIIVDKKLVMEVIGRNSLEMLNSGMRNLGVGGIYYFANCLEYWKDHYSEMEIRETCRIAHDAIENDGTGGGLFRYMYADFLDYAYGTTDIDALRDIGDGYRQAGRMWTQTAKLLKEISSCGCSSLTEAAQSVNAIAAKEHELQTGLLCAANLCCKSMR